MGSLPSTSLTVIVLTYNEEIHLQRCIESFSHIARKIYVVDSFSTDRTVEIAEKLGAIVHQRKFVNQADQFQWALDNLHIDTDWIMRVDADEYLSQYLADSLAERLPRADARTTGFSVNRQIVFLGRPIRHGGFYPMRSLKIWRTGKGRIQQRWMDEHAVVDEGSVQYCPGDLIDENLRDLSWWIAKHNGYAAREMLQQLAQELRWNIHSSEPQGRGSSRQVVAGYLRDQIYPLIPRSIRAFLYFVYRYIGRLGFLDGYEGLIFHVLQGFWYRFLVDAKLFEARRAISLEGEESYRCRLISSIGIST
ncbi:glycosyltransferase family 2 protein [Bradyrhizobium vignae]|uniref:glycosyltransferase family 2 protein n=1 Tax=Bradyrhizobium vignae TaxID=1549949 RepID=UPI00100AD304|nr:glycosyltransferase family 2 protein [Bradyrhizobium vignae]RXG85986.1 glycosyltransferase family 2 protein [Bradyrhizobium vignae]